ncbi:hypothetical protein IGS68_29435 (plasmid) [Skermanella sp. TT6]|uniref:Uncharacterized protein n=1 Tax=Skermanella cutis TaxID=2775420 RepID=A0ABX7BHK3_9PROT|nr:hypothetical protein [Skermanella sp. TT6]QQP93246.1 hypothetical protein IGS68_29435 [Skermanella sp. TT6]
MDYGANQRQGKSYFQRPLRVIFSLAARNENHIVLWAARIIVTALPELHMPETKPTKTKSTPKRARKAPVPRTSKRRAYAEIAVSLVFLAMTSVTVVKLAEHRSWLGDTLDVSTRHGLVATVAFSILALAVLSLDWLQPNQQRAEIARTVGLRCLIALSPAVLWTFGANDMLPMLQPVLNALTKGAVS